GCHVTNGDLLTHHQVPLCGVGLQPMRCRMESFGLLPMVRLMYALSVRPRVAPKVFFLLSVSSLLRQAVHVGGQQVHLVIAQEGFLGGHLAVTTVTDALLDLGEAGT